MHRCDQCPTWTEDSASLKSELQSRLLDNPPRKTLEWHAWANELRVARADAALPEVTVLAHGADEPLARRAVRTAEAFGVELEREAPVVLGLGQDPLFDA